MRPVAAWAAITCLLSACGDEPRRSPADASPAHDWRGDVLYFAMVDRFVNGSSANDDLGVPGCFDPADPDRHHGGDLAGVEAALPYLQELGVTTLWLTPLFRQVEVGGACGYHGYWPDFHLPDDGALEPKLGGEADLDSLREAMADGGPRLVIDLVVNHAGYGASIVTRAPEWFHDADDCAAAGDPEVGCALFGLPDFAQEDPDVAAYLTAMSTSWLERTGAAGVRMDTAKHVPLTYFREEWIPAVRSARPNALLVAEVFTGGSAHDLLRYLEAGFDSAFDFGLRGALVSALAHDGSFDQVAGAMQDVVTELGIERAQLLTSFLGNHDLSRFVSELPAELPAAERAARYHVALGALFTLPGIPQLSWGDELGMEGPAGDSRRDFPGWALEPEGVPEAAEGFLAPAATLAWTRELIALRRAHPALSHGDYLELWRPNGGADVLFFYRRTAGEQVIVALSNEGGPTSALVPLRTHPEMSLEAKAGLADGTVFRGVRGEAELVVTEGDVVIELPGRGAYLWASP